MAKIQLLIVEDHKAVRNALSTRLRSSARINVLAAVHSAEMDAMDMKTLHPDVALIGWKSSSDRDLGSTVRIVERLSRDGTAVIVMTSYADEAERELLYHAGASSYLLKDINSPQLIAAIEAAERKRPSLYLS